MLRLPFEAAKALKGGLRVDTREGLTKGGDSGPAIVGGKPDESLLLDALRHDGIEMPPKGKLPDAVVADFERWVKMGAPTRAADGRRLRRQPSRGDRHRGRPAVLGLSAAATARAARGARRAWPATDIDRFLLAALEARNVRPTHDADRATLARRLSFDLIGCRRRPRRSMRSSTIRRRSLTKRSSIACSPRPTSASAGAGTGSTSPASPSR